MSDGKTDIISMLYSDQGIPAWPTPNNTDPYDYTINKNAHYNKDFPTNAMKTFYASSTEKATSVKPGGLMMTDLDYDNGELFRTVVRGYVKKFPGFTSITGFPSLSEYTQQFVSFYDYKF